MPETNIISVQEQKQLQVLNNGLLTADKFITKNYLINLSKQNVVLMNEDEMDSRFIRLFQILKLVYDKKENVNDKLISVYSTLQNINASTLLIIDGDGREVKIYIGVRSKESASTAISVLEKSFLGNFTGSSLRNMRNSEISKLMKSIVTSERTDMQRNVSCVTVVPSMRDKDKDKFVQGIEKFINTMQGQKYTALFIAEPISKADLESRKRGFEEMYSSLSPLMKTSLAYGVNTSKAVTKGMFENFAHSINNSVSNTTGRSSSTSNSTTVGRSSGSSWNFGIYGTNSGKSTSKTSGYTSGESWSKSVTSGTADTKGSGTNESDTQTTGDSRTMTVEHHNKSVEVLLSKIDNQLKRIKASEAFGVWECASYFIADDIQTSVVAANAYKALMLGDETDVENSFVNVWSINESQEQIEKVLDYMQNCMHPIIEIGGEDGFEEQYVTPANYINGKELPMLMGLPHKSVTGLTVSNIAEFGRNVFIQNAKPNKKEIRIGQIYHMGNVEASVVNLDLNSFTSHCFVTGSTGSGKSNTTYCLLEKFMDNGVPFLVVEPAKGEYKTAFGAVEGINVFSTNPSIGQMLKLNPFRFDPKIHILEHLDRLIEIFNACWEMYAAMPAILKDAVEQIYTEKGWDLLNSVYLGPGEPVYPTFSDLLRRLPEIINSSNYSSDTKGDYTGALVTRVNSLTNGISGEIFCDCYDIPDNVMFDENTVVDLSRVGSAETKSLIMGIIVLKLVEYRMANANEANQGLRHVTVLEEAHNLLKRVTQGAAGSNVVGKSVEMICNSIAEMRTYGEGFIIVDQSPTAVDIAAIKNTNTKILMRLPEKGDCEAVGNAVGLNEDQMKELSRLGTGVAVVMQNNWLEAVLAKIDAFSNKYEKEFVSVPFEQQRVFRGKVLSEFIYQFIQERKLDIDKLVKIIEESTIAEDKKKEMRNCIESAVSQLIQNDYDISYFAEVLLNVSRTRNLFNTTKQCLQTASTASQQGRKEFTYDSVVEWKQTFLKEIIKFVDMPENYLNAACKYLVYAVGRNLDKDYYSVYKALYLNKN